ncbi:hypothetical protein HMPREF3216_00664, partial [Gardnerella vaginalis]
MIQITFFPLFVRDLGQIWYKVRKFFPKMLFKMAKLTTKSGNIVRADCIKRGGDSRFFALNEMNLSIFDGDSSNEEEKS